MSNKVKIEVSNTGFNIEPSQEYLNKRTREKRIADYKAKDKSKITNVEIGEMLEDLADRQSEIYDMLKELV